METKICSKCGIEKLLGEFHKSKNKKLGVHPQCKICRRLYTQSGEGLAVAEDRAIYDGLDPKGQGRIDKLASQLVFSPQKRVTASPYNSFERPKKLNMGTDSARHVIFSLIRWMSIQEL